MSSMIVSQRCITPDESGSSTVLYSFLSTPLFNFAVSSWSTAWFILISILVEHFGTGDISQTHDSNVTLSHCELNPKKGQTVSYLNDYAFHDNTRRDTWGRFIERNAAYQPCIWTAGNHELDFAPRLVKMVKPQPIASQPIGRPVLVMVYSVSRTQHMPTSVGTPNQDGYAVEADSFSN
ncbi:hypothetical protein V6N11_030378 [Hibiscus sabdariffa]|uniref:Acid phosphatase n=1 Tax=Hibiscus sabdariffa TaxID=183260 RepID=A0ABR2PLF6_9ROSI